MATPESKKPRPFTISPGREFAGQDLKAETIQTVERALNSLNEACLTISQEYNEAARVSDQDARFSFPEEKVRARQAELESLFTKDCTMTNPFGVVGDRASTIESILSGKIRKTSFVSTKERIQVVPQADGNHTVTSVGAFEIDATVQAKNLRTGKIGPRNISGTYYTTHTYVVKDGQMKLASTHIGLDQLRREFAHGADEPGGEELASSFRFTSETPEQPDETRVQRQGGRETGKEGKEGRRGKK